MSSKVADYTAAGKLKPDPADDTRSIFTIEMSIDNGLIEEGAIELAAYGKGWEGTESAADFLIAWAKKDAADTALMVATAKAQQQLDEQMRNSFASKL